MERSNSDKLWELPGGGEAIGSFLDDLPLVERPWEAIARAAALSEAKVLESVRSWQTAGVFRHIRGLWNNEKLGYRSSLLAVAAEAGKEDETGEMIARCPFVSHDFLRMGAEFNIWFTLTCPEKGPTLETTIEELRQQLGTDVRRFDTVRVYKISFRTLFGQGGQRDWAEDARPRSDVGDESLLRAIGVLQEDIPLVDRPFEVMADRVGWSEAELLSAARVLKHRRILRRVGVIWNFRKMGEVRNVMCAWDGPESEMDAFGRHAADHPRVSHCYRRVTYPDWPWKVYTMIHGRDEADCVGIIEGLSAGFAGVRHLALWTAKEYKQTPIRYEAEKVVLG